MRNAVPRPGGSPVHRAAPIDTHGQDDASLLRTYCQSRCPEAFQALVRKHIGWVQSLVRRHVKDRHLSEDVTQAVFIILARKAPSIPHGTQLSAWLFRVARFAANDAVKHESRRRKRMERVAEMQTSAQRMGADATQLKAEAAAVEPELDDALACLSDSDRQTILLRFYEDKSIAEVGVALGISEDAAKQRVSRALKRLRSLLQRKGIKVASIGAVLSILINSSSSASAATVTNGVNLVQFVKIATGQTEAAGRSLQLVQATLKAITGAQVRLWAAVAGSAFSLSIAVTVFSPALGQIISPWLDAAQGALVWAHGSGDAVLQPAETEAPAASKPNVSRLWVGSSNDRAWPIYPRSTTPIPIPVRSLSGADHPVAIAEDPSGKLWYRKVEPDLLSNLAARDDRYRNYDELNPYSALASESDLLRLLPPTDFSAHSFSAGDGVEWLPLDTPPDDGYVVFPFNTMDPAINGKWNSINLQIEYVPEPAFLGLSIAAATMLLRRRRPR